MIDRLTTVWKIGVSYGFSWLTRRLIYELQVRSGFQKIRFRRRAWDGNELKRWLHPRISAEPERYATYWRKNRRPFFFAPSDRNTTTQALHNILGEIGVKTLREKAQQIREGRFSYFSSQLGELGFPPDWHKNPFTNQCTSSTDHWSDIPMYSRETGDLKYIWETARFESAYTLARAYWASGDDVHAETFWKIVESWHRDNPPHHGAHWRCGQEISLRLMAWCFALFAMANAPATTPERLAMLVGMMAAQADRVARGHIYAHLQRNNHAISEGVGLFTIGLLFPELRQAERWCEQGRKILEYEAQHQIASDGSYVQNSVNYHRVMLQDFLWALRLGEVNDAPLSDVVYQQVRCAVKFLAQLQSNDSGQLPYYGPDDGALVTPFNECEYSDFRPVLAAGHYLLDQKRIYENGPWHEDLLWLFGPDAIHAPSQPITLDSLAAHDGGYYVLRGLHSSGLTRCTTYQYRPAQADMLALDIWWRGANIACDPASYAYLAEPPWDNAFVHTAVHNTITISKQDQMERGPRFIWLNWVKASLLTFRCSGQHYLEHFEGLHHGYTRLDPPAIHQRAIVRAGDDVWVVIDDIKGRGTQPTVCQWLLPADDYVFDTDHNILTLTYPPGKVKLHLAAWNFEDQTANVTCGNETHAPRGWRSRYYGVREPAVSFQIEGLGQMPCRIVSVFVMGNTSKVVMFNNTEVVVSGADEDFRLTIALAPQKPLGTATDLIVQNAELMIAGCLETL